MLVCTPLPKTMDCPALPKPSICNSMPSLTPILAGPYSDSRFEITPSADVAAQHLSKDQGNEFKMKIHFLPSSHTFSVASKEQPIVKSSGYMS